MLASVFRRSFRLACASLRAPLGAALILLLTACASQAPMTDGDVLTAAPVEYFACEGFFVYEICLADIEGDGVVDYTYFGDDLQIFMWRPGVTLPETMPLHRCGKAMTPEVTAIGNQLLHSENLSLLQEMDAKRRLLLLFLEAKDGVDECYGGDSTKGIPGGSAPDEPFADDEFDWDSE